MASAASGGAGSDKAGGGSSLWTKCMRFSENARKNSPRVHALLKKMESRGCSLASDPIVCEDIFAGAKVTGAYDSVRKAVVMNPAVPDSAMTQAEWTRTITHELVHAYDFCRVKFESSNCSHLACSEVRAANLSGDCDFGVELQRGHFDLKAHQPKCVRRRAELSLQLHPRCKELDVKAAVDRVFEPCYADTTPFATN